MKEKDKVSKVNRRDFFKVGGLSAVVGASAVLALPKKVVANKINEKLANDVVTVHDDFPVEVRADYVPPRNWDHVQARSIFVDAVKAIGDDVDDEIVADGIAFVKKNEF